MKKITDQTGAGCIEERYKNHRLSGKGELTMWFQVFGVLLTLIVIIIVIYVGGLILRAVWELWRMRNDHNRHNKT